MDAYSDLPWTGGLPFDVVTVAGHPLGTAELKVHREVVDVWFGDRCLAVLPRAELHAWVTGGCERPYRRHDVALCVVQGRLAMQLGNDGVPHHLPPEVSARLRQL